jgi:hypothetical protein
MKFLIVAICFNLGLPGWVHAAEPTGELNEELAKRLIAEVWEIRSDGISVATVIEGGKRSEDGFEERHLRRVTAVHPVPENGRMVRRVRCYDFSWSPRYGWFYKEIRTSRSGEEVRIWSETEGELVVR